MVDSRTATSRRTGGHYVTSVPDDGRWAQPPAAQHVLVVIGGSMYGNLIELAPRITSSSETLDLCGEMEGEFDLWDRASDEALLDFEKDLG